MTQSHVVIAGDSALAPDLIAKLAAALEPRGVKVQHGFAGEGTWMVHFTSLEGSDARQFIRDELHKVDPHWTAHVQVREP